MRKNWQNLNEIVKELLYVLPKKYKKKSLSILFFIITSSAFELLGVTAILPFIQTLLSPEKVLANPVVHKIAVEFKIMDSKGLLLLMGIGLILIYMIKNIYVLFAHFIQYDFATKVQKSLAIKMLNSYMSRPYSYFLDVNSSEILRGCNDDITGVYAIISDFFTILSEMLTICMIGIFIIYADPIIAAGTLLLMFLVMLGMIFLFKPVMKKTGIKNMAANAAKNKAVYQAINGIKEIFVMQRKECFVKDFEEAAETARKVRRNYDVVNSSPDRIIEGICVSGLIGIVCIRLMQGVDMVEFVPQLAAFAMATFKILPSIGKITSRVTEIVYYRPMLKNVYEIMRDADHYIYFQDGYEKERKRLEIDSASVKFQKQLTVERVTWQYTNQKEPVLQGTDLIVNKGETVALIGASGAGKTTLADMVLGLLNPKQGSIKMDGIDVYTMPEHWAKIVGYVPQSVFLTDDTVRNNIIFGLKEDISEEKIWEALERAQLKSFIESLPQGLDTVVGERGVKFSGGQKQRIAIARALYNKPEILVLDEATAALDNETETAVMESIDALHGKITMIIVAHRLTTIKNCDSIYEIIGGKAVKRNKAEVLNGVI